MTVDLRIIRAIADKTWPPPPLTALQQQHYDQILKIGEQRLAEHGCHRVTVKSLANELKISVGKFRYHFVDIHALLGEILRLHLLMLTTEITKILHGTENLHKKRREIYYKITRTPRGNLTPAHLLLVRDRASLPNDLLPGIETARSLLGRLLATNHHEKVLDFIDLPGFDLTAIEALTNALPKSPLQQPRTTSVPDKMTRAGSVVIPFPEPQGSCD